jgi:hypothetical protein
VFRTLSRDELLRIILQLVDCLSHNVSPKLNDVHQKFAEYQKKFENFDGWFVDLLFVQLSCKCWSLLTEGIGHKTVFKKNHTTAQVVLTNH